MASTGEPAVAHVAPIPWMQPPRATASAPPRRGAVRLSSIPGLTGRFPGVELSSDFFCAALQQLARPTRWAYVLGVTAGP